MKKSLILRLIFCCMAPASLSLQAQSNKVRFANITGDPEGAQSYFSSILQDSQGNIWMCSENGLSRYNGYNETKYRYDPFDPNSLSQNIIYNFWIDPKDTIWIGTTDGLCKFDRKTEKFTRFTTALYPKMPDLGNVIAINEDNQGYLWIGNLEGKLWRFDRAKGIFEPLTQQLQERKANHLSADFHEEMHLIFKDKSGNMWVGNSNGLHKFLIKPGKTVKGNDSLSVIHFFHNSADNSSISDNYVRNIMEDHKGILWVGASKGLYRFDAVSGKFIRYFGNPTQSFSLSSDYIHQIAEDTKGNLWIATDNGLNKLDSSRTRITTWFENPADPYALNSNNIYGLIAEAGENLFLCGPKGVQSLSLNQKAFGILQHDPANPGSISHNQILAITGEGADQVWIGTNGGGMDQWNRKTGQITHYRYDPKNPNGLRNDYVSALLKDQRGDLWVCNGEYLSRKKQGSASFEHFDSNVKNLKNKDARALYAICQGSNGLIWLGSGNGIKRFNPLTRQFRHYFYEPGNPYGIADYTVNAIFEDSRGNIWVGNGSIAFNKFDKQTGRFTHFKNNPLDTNSISSNIVKCAFEDSKGNLWLGTSGGGLCQYDYSSQHFITHTRHLDLPWNTVYSIQEDKAGNLWLGTEKGLSCYQVSQKKFINFDVNDGLQNDEFASGFRSRGSSFKAADGALYFGGCKGLNYFDPAQIRANPFVPPIVITQFKIFDKLQPGQNEAKVIELDYNQNFFSFEFAALNYTNTPRNKYAYRLVGFDPDWIYCGARRYAGYTNLNPGEYTFKVKGSNNDDIWNEAGISIKVIIRPPWWRTWWAYLGLFFSISGMIIGIIYVRAENLRKENKRLEEKVTLRTHELSVSLENLKSTQSQLIQSEKMASLGELTAGIAHEIQNPLNFVNNFSEVSNELITEMNEELDKGDIAEAKAIATDIQQNLEKINHHGKRADAIVKGMLQHSRASSGKKEPTDINALADEYLRLAYHGLRSKDHSFNATLETHFDESIGKIDLIPQDMGRVILNLINNAFYAVAEKKKQHPEGYEPTVSVSTKKVGDKVEIRIKDNGAGIPQKVLDKIFQPFFTTKPTGQGTGLGLSLSYDIVKAHGGELKALENENTQGAVFKITLNLS